MPRWDTWSGIEKALSRNRPTRRGLATVRVHIVPKIMTQDEARQIISEFTGDRVQDAYLNAESLRAICYALPTKEEALDFLFKVKQSADTEAIAYGANFKRLKQNALKLQLQMQDDLTLF